MSTKTIIILCVIGGAVIGGTISYFKWFKPMIDKKREENRQAETKVIQQAQSPSTGTVTGQEVTEQVKSTGDKGPGFGGMTK